MGQHGNTKVINHIFLKSVLASFPSSPAGPWGWGRRCQAIGCRWRWLATSWPTSCLTCSPTSGSSCLLLRNETADRLSKSDPETLFPVQVLLVSAERRHADSAEDWRQPWDQRLPEGRKTRAEWIQWNWEFLLMLSVSLPPIQRLAMDPRCKGMPLSSFLLKPMQRVTRYPLIIKNVCNTPRPNAPRISRLQML